MVLLLQLPHTESVSRKFKAPTCLAGNLGRKFAQPLREIEGCPCRTEMYVGRTATTAGEEKKRKRVRRAAGGAGEKEVVKYRNLNCLTLPGGGKREVRGKLGTDKNGKS